jgi:hypothetical protein
MSLREFSSVTRFLSSTIDKKIVIRFRMRFGLYYHLFCYSSFVKASVTAFL